MCAQKRGPENPAPPPAYNFKTHSSSSKPNFSALIAELEKAEGIRNEGRRLREHRLFMMLGLFEMGLNLFLFGVAVVDLLMRYWDIG